MTAVPLRDMRKYLRAGIFKTATSSNFNLIGYAGFNAEEEEDVCIAIKGTKCHEKGIDQ